jgi:hypothetical protein
LNAPLTGNTTFSCPADNAEGAQRHSHVRRIGTWRESAGHGDQQLDPLVGLGKRCLTLESQLAGRYRLV